MNEQHSDLLERARGLAAAKALIDAAVAELVDDALRNGVSRTALASALRVHRSTVYRFAID